MILQRPSLSVDENTVYTAVEKWAAKTCQERNLEPSYANRREVLGAALFLVRFPLLTDVQLAAGPIQSGLLLPTELRDIFLHKNAPEKPALPFPTEPRTSVQHRVGPYQYREAVFAQCCGGDYYPGEVVEERGRDLVVQWCREDHKLNQALRRRVIRAADILTFGQRVQCWEAAGMYCMSRDDKHVVEVDGREMVVDFADLMIPEKVVRDWQAANSQLLG